MKNCISNKKYVSRFLVLAALLLGSPLGAQAATASITATPNSSPLYVGGTVTVSWKSSGAALCNGTGFSTGGATSGTKVVAVSTAGAKTYAVSCFDASPACSLVLQNQWSDFGGGGSSNTCVAPRITYYGSSCYPKGQTCSTTSGGGYNRFGEPNEVTHSTYQCQGGCSTVTASSNSVTAVEPPPPPTPSATIIASANPITSGSTLLISWSSVRATSCRGTGFSTGGNTSGSVTVTPTQSTTYSITCDSEVYSSAPGTYQYSYTDITDLWCTQGPPPPSYSNVYTEHECSVNNPEGQACVGSEHCAVNRWSGGRDTVGGPTNYCNLVSEVYRCNGGSAPNQITDSVTVDLNTTPNAPTISGPASGTANTSYTFTFRATDPDSDTVRYRIDWDPSSSIDQNSSYGTSNWSYSTTRSWSSPGTYSFRARTQDEHSAQSSYTTHTIVIDSGEPQCNDGIDNDGDGRIDTNDYGCSGGGDTSESPNPQCSDGVNNDADSYTDYPNDPGCISAADDTESPNPQCSDGIDNDGNGLIDLADSGCENTADNNESTPEVEADVVFTVTPNLVRTGNPVLVAWSVTNVDSCTVAGSNGNSWTGVSGSETSSTITAETTFVIVCDETDGDVISTSETVRLVPTFEEVFRTLPQNVAVAFLSLWR